MQNSAWTLVVALVILASSSAAVAQSEGDFIVSVRRKQEDKYKNRWTLADWFETQRKSRLQDMWLKGHNSSDPFEFFVGGQTASIESKVTSAGVTTINSFRENTAVAGAYASLAGLEGSVTDLQNRGHGWDASANIRLFGDSIQNTHLLVGYGLKYRDENEMGSTSETIQNQVARGGLTLYLTPFLGVSGLYQRVLAAKSNLENQFEGDRVEASAFIDYVLVRPYGTWHRESITRTDTSGGKIERVREGVYVGLKMFL